jgi:hypothetical protein
VSRHNRERRQRWQPGDGPMDMGRWRRSILETVRRLGRKFRKPDDDWANALFLFSEARGAKVVHVEYRGESRAEEVAAKEAFVADVPRLFLDYRPTHAAWVASCWTVATGPDDPFAELTKDMVYRFGVASHPGREEAILASLGDGSTYELHMAKIVRHPDRPPTLENWEDVSDGELGGRTAGLLQAGFAALREK